MTDDEEYFNLPPHQDHLDPDTLEDPDEYVGEDIDGYTDDDDEQTDGTDEAGSRGDQLIGLFDTSSEEDRKEFFGSDIFQSWLKSLLKQAGGKYTATPESFSFAETAPAQHGYNGSVSAAALRLAAKAVALWEREYP